MIGPSRRPGDPTPNDAAVEAERERIAVAIENHWLCDCTDTYCAIRNTAQTAARIARSDVA